MAVKISKIDWNKLSAIEEELNLTALLKKISEKADDKEKGNLCAVHKLERCFRLLQKEFLIDCLKEEVKERDKKEIKRNIRDALLPDGKNCAIQNAFVFGTGVSMGKPFCIPNWSTLLQLTHKAFFLERYGEILNDKDIGNVFNSTDLYELAQYLESNLLEDILQEYGNDFQIGTYNRLYSLIEDALYLRSPKKISKAMLQDSFIQYVAQLAEEYKINRILTYNYDDCFESTYLTLFPSGKITPIFVDEQLPYANEREAKQVYHVHGLIPKYYNYKQKFIFGNTYIKWLRSAEARHIVLTEDSYEEIAHSNYKWRNTVQADTFVRYNCFIFGFSASDRNFKRLTRLIDWHQNEITGPLISQPVRHYIFLTIDEYLKEIFHESVPPEEGNKDLDDKFFQNLTSLMTIEGQEYDTETLVTKLQFLYYTLCSKRKYLRRYHIYPIWTTISDLKKRVESIIKY